MGLSAKAKHAVPTSSTGMRVFSAGKVKSSPLKKWKVSCGNTVRFVREETLKQVSNKVSEGGGSTVGRKVVALRKESRIKL